MASDFEKNVQDGKSAAEKRTEANAQPNPQPPGTPAVPGLDVFAGNVDPAATVAVLNSITSLLGVNGQTKDGARVTLTRDVSGPTYGITYDGDTSEAGNLGLGESKSANTSYGMTGKGGIQIQDEVYSDYLRGGFIENNNERINDAVITAAEGDPAKYESIFNAAVREAAVRQSAGESPHDCRGSPERLDKGRAA